MKQRICSYPVGFISGGDDDLYMTTSHDIRSDNIEAEIASHNTLRITALREPLQLSNSIYRYHQLGNASYYSIVVYKKYQGQLTCEG